MLGGSFGSLGTGGLPPGRGLGGLPASVIGLGGLPGCPGSEGLGVILGGPLSLRGGGGAPGFTGELENKKINTVHASLTDSGNFKIPQ